MINMKEKRKGYLAPLVVLIIAALLSLFFYIYRTERFRDWQSTVGIITDYKVTKSHSRRGGTTTTHSFHYTYTVDNVTYTGTDSFGGVSKEYHIGDDTEVWYDPQNHADSAMGKPGPELYVYAPLFLAAPLALAACTSSILSRNKRND